MDNSKIITFVSPKGGVGQTLIALNTAIALSLKGKKTILLDFDLGAPQGIEKLMGQKCKYSFYSLMKTIDSFKRGQRKFENYVVTHPQSKLNFLPAILHRREGLSLKPEHIRDFLSFLTDHYDYIVIDSGNRLTDNLVTTFDLSNLLLLVLTPDIAALYQVEWIIDMFRELGFPLKMVKTIVNRAESKGGVSLEEIELMLAPKVISAVPSEGKTVGFAVNKGSPVITESPQAKISKAIEKLSDDLINKKELYIERKELSEVRIKKTVEDQEQSFLAKIGAASEVPQRKVDEEEDAMIKLKKRIHARLLTEIDLKRIPVEKIVSDERGARALREKAKKVVSDIIADEAGGFISSVEVRRRVIKEILDEAFGLGPLEDLLSDSTVTEIMVNNKNQIFIEKEGKVSLTTKKFISNDQIRVIIERILAPLGRRIDESSPYVDARLPDGSRVNAIIPPLSLTGPTLTIRKFSRERLSMEDLLNKFGSISESMAKFLKASVESRKNILVSGGTGSGKTTLLNILSSYIGANERIVTIEDSAELRLWQNHWIRLESRPPNIEGRGEVTIRDLFRNSLRMRPDRIVVGECRSKETLDMLQAMNTGHDGSMSTVHANSPRDLLMRLDSMILMSGVELPLRAIREMISSAVDLVVQVSRLSDGTRKVVKITEISGMLDETHINLQDIFTFRQTGLDQNQKVLGDFVPLGNIPTYYDEMKARGIELPRDMFIPEE